MKETLALLRRVLGHDAGERMTLQLCHERERDAGVATRRLEQRATAVELAGGFSGFDHRLGDAVLDRAGRIQSLELCVHATIPARAQLDEGGGRDQLEQARCD